MYIINLFLITLVSGLIGSALALILSAGHVARRVDASADRLLSDHPEIVDRFIDRILDRSIESMSKKPEILEDITDQAMAAAFSRLHKMSQEDPDGLVNLLGPITGVVVKKVKDHLFSATGVMNKKAKGELQDMQGSILEEMTGGLISSKLMDEYPLIGGLLQVAMSNPAILQRLGIPLPGIETAGSASEAIGGLIQQ